jgi:cytoskeletal protein RodZ
MLLNLFHYQKKIISTPPQMNQMRTENDQPKHRKQCVKGEHFTWVMDLSLLLVFKIFIVVVFVFVFDVFDDLLMINHFIIV